MALSPTAIKYIAVGVVIAVAIIVIGSIIWDVLQAAVGLLIGVGLIYLGVRFILGKGLPKSMEKIVDKAVKQAKDDDDKPKDKE